MTSIDNDILTPGAPRTNIPTVLTSFIGRKRDIAEIRRLLASSRLLTLTGAAGCGKTRLALRAAAEVNSQYAGGVYWVGLAQLADPALVPPTVAKVLRVSEQSGLPVIETLLEALQGKQILLVLDNCEHLLGGCIQLIETLLAAPEVSVLTTSREPLDITGEMRYPVSPMTLPPAGLPEHDLGQFDAIQLFVERARAILPHFELTPENASAVASICFHLDGIPLAIELATARVNVLTVEQISARLDDRFELLATSPRMTDSHHQTLRGAIDWSYDLLSISEQIMLLRLSVFAGGCSLATAEDVCAGEGVERKQILELLSSLVNKSLVVAQTLQRGEARYSLLETIRQYAQEKLLATGEWPALRDRHLEHFLALTEDTEPKLSGQFQQLWLSYLEGEYDNVRAALAWSLESGRIQAGLRIAVALYQFWVIRDYVEEGFAWVERLLPQADGSVSIVVRANALAHASLLAGFRHHTVAQMAYGREAAALAEAAGDEGKLALYWALAGQAYAARGARDYQTEFALAKRLTQLNRELGRTFNLALNLSLYSPTAMVLGKYDEAHAMLNEALPLLRELGNPYRIALALNYSGDLARCERDYAGALLHYEESIAILRGIGALRDLASVLHNLGHACLHLGDIERSHALFNESMSTQQAQHNEPGMTECLIGFAALAVVRGIPAAGARLLAVVVAIAGEHVASGWAATRMEYEHYLALARAGLTETEFQAEQAAGRALSLEQAVEYAQSLPLKSASIPAIDKPDDITIREREVAALIAQGKSNGEIADELVVSKRTIEKHVANILSKLGFTTRAQIVRWAIEAGLVKSNE